jgi:hypothetical protein
MTRRSKSPTLDRLGAEDGARQDARPRHRPFRRGPHSSPRVKDPISLTGFDVKHPLRIVALNASVGRRAGLRRSPREGPESALKHACAFIRAPATGATGGERSFVDRGKDVALNSRGIARARGAIGSGDGAKCPSLGSHTLKASEQEPCSPSQQAGARPPDSGLQDRRGRICQRRESPRPSNSRWP